ncbi:MAG TPA: MFS transporter, partial [Terrimesophilobacter sp.]|nr:MFS transporter [Terrimesophilobacter sp.]
MTGHTPTFRWGSLAFPVLLPTLAFAVGEGAIIPVIPIVAHALGADLALAGVITGLLLIGHLVGDIPSGWVVARIGERSSMIWAALLAVVASSVAAIAPSLIILGVAVFVIGLSAAVFALARHAFMTMFVPYSHRARSLATLGGTFRLGIFIGPFIAAAIIAGFASSQAVFWLTVLGALLAGALLVFMRDPETVFANRTQPVQSREGDATLATKPAGLFRTIALNRSVLIRLGAGSTIVSAVRASRQVILPLWAVSIGVSEANIALIIGIGGAVDFALFNASGQVMDRWGRLASALPSLLGLGLGLLVLAVTHDLAAASVWFIALTVVLGMANGIGSGILMTLGADLADKSNPAPFLGAWRFTNDLGGATSPLAIAGLT